WWEKLEDGYYYGTGYGEDAQNWYVQQWVDTGNWVWAIPGGVASLWTRETYEQTVWTLRTAVQLNDAYVKPHYSQVQYSPENNPSYNSKWSTRGSTNDLPHSLGKEAHKALNLPDYNPPDAARNVKVNPFKPLRGPRPVDGGTGIEYYRG
ncbi:MAG: hypothetical protein L6416_11460, partial [Candidatus Omnitrophica bacterium]|nr:hypothetical protein [Candidatus Omnitrophota bacterium]